MQNTTKIYLKQQQLICECELNLANLVNLEKIFATIAWPAKGEILIDGSKITVMDSAGAWFLLKWVNKLTSASLTFRLANFSERAERLITLVQNRSIKSSDIPQEKAYGWLERFGRMVVGQLDEFVDYLAFIGKLSTEALRIIARPAHLRWKAFAGSIDTTGYQALPIIALLSFMIGVVLTYQMGVQLRNYGANIFIVDLLGISVLREFGPLITAIMVAGRTGSSFTAQLGLMKANQEIDALNTMGITPGELLLLPRIAGLVVALPLLTVWADIFGVFGGMFMANNMLGISFYDFLHRFSQQIPLRALIIGIGKAPVFALIISSIGCFQGMKVKDNADSIGKNTTKSVVSAIFFIIVADAIFSIIFSKLKL
ncbi:MAG: MlaE family lipid ABC transporter permease subunit [Gammaproteobacteria bacterium]